jgi:glycosyltransferase involved in cell wall biosynthesis
VSEQVAEAIQTTGRVNGPVFVIPNGVTISEAPSRLTEKDRRVDVLLCGLKTPELARKLEQRFANRELIVNSLLTWMPRSEYLHWLNNARVAVTLPRPSEGFYLPAIEAMALGALVVCPDCVGNRDFCHDGVNCFRPAYDELDIVTSIERAVAMSPEKAAEMRKHADATVAEHSLERERARFFEILERVDDLWRG